MVCMIRTAREPESTINREKKATDGKKVSISPRGGRVFACDEFLAERPVLTLGGSAGCNPKNWKSTRHWMGCERKTRKAIYPLDDGAVKEKLS